MPRRPLISVVVPVYAAAASLERCLTSLAGQTLEDIEIIAVDDASPDDSREIIENHARGDARFKCIVNAQRGNLYDARRNGFSQARGEYLAACDADDRMPANGLRDLYSGAVRTGADIVHGRTRLSINGRTKGIFHLCEPFAATSGPEYIRSFANFRRGWTVWGKLYHRSIWEKIAPHLPENKNWFSGEDLLFSYQFALNAVRYIPIRETVYHYTPPRGDYFCSPGKAVNQARGQIEILSHILDLAAGTSPAHTGTANAIETLCIHIVETILRNNGVSPHSENALANLLERSAADVGERFREVVGKQKHSRALTGARLLTRGGIGEAYIAVRRLLWSLKFRGLKKTCDRLFS